MNDTMRGLFFVMKGQYRKIEPSFTNKVSGDIMHIGGYDPYNEDTEEWYGVYDNQTYHCICCGRDLDRVIKSVYREIKKYKGDARKYFRFVKEVIEENYKVSPIMKHMHEKVYEEYGDFFREEVEEMEDLAYKELKEETPLNKTRKLLSKVKPTGGVVKTETPQKKEVEVSTPKKVKPKVKMGVKKLPME